MQDGEPGSRPKKAFGPTVRKAAGSSSPIEGSLLLPSGRKPLRNAPFFDDGVGVLLERLDRNEWPTHAHEHWQVTILFENAAWDISWRNVTGDSISRRIVGGQVWVIPPGWLHEVKSVGYGTAIVVYVTPAKLSAVQRLPTEALVASLTDFVTIDPLVAEMCRCLLSLYAAPSNGSLARIVGLGRLLALLIIEIAARNPSNNIGPPIGRAGQLVEKVRQLLEISQ